MTRTTSRLLLLLLTIPVFANCQSFSLSTTDASTNTTNRSYGVAIIDVDNDDDLDLFVTSIEFSNSEFFTNDGNGNFSGVTGSVLTADAFYTYGTSWGDYDNDGDMDCFIANRDEKNNLYRNDAGLFTEILAGNIVNDIGSSRSGAWADYDNDGCLDLFVTNQFNSSNYLYKSNCDGSFSKVLTGSIVTDQRNSYGCSWCDIDLDGDLDLLVLNAQQNSSLYENNGDGTFSSNTTSELVQSGIGQWNHGICWGDVDNDLDMDLYISNVSGSNYLFLNEGGLNFTEVLISSAVTDVGETTGNAWIDVENDGDLDLIATNRLGDNNELYLNDGTGELTSSTSIISTSGGDSRGVAIGDLNNDGTQDIYIANEFENNFLFYNLDTVNYWLKVSLEGVESNRAAIGAKVFVKAHIWDKDVWQYQEITTQSGYLSQGSVTADFGLGNAWEADTVIIKWPSGLVCVYSNVPADQTFSLTESCNPVDVISEFASSSHLQLYPNPTTGRLEYQFSESEIYALEVFNLNGKRIPHRINQSTAGGVIQLDEDLPNGMYVVQVVNLIRIYHQKFFLNH